MPGVAIPVTKKYLSFSGGGAKGSFYVSAVTALHKSKDGKPSVMAGIECIGGASAGAITAALLATGITVEDFKKESDLDFKSLLDISKKNNYLERGVCDGNLLLAKAREVLEMEIRKRLQEAHNKIMSDPTTDFDKEKLPLLYRLSKIKPQHITFDDFDFLHKILPDKVKQLVISGTNVTDNKLEYFSAATTPLMEVALAVRISASFPIIFKQVEYNGKRYIDGGAKDNLPLDALHALSNKNGELDFLDDAAKRDQTLAFVLGKSAEKDIENVKVKPGATPASVFGYKHSVVSNLLKALRRWFERVITQGVEVSYHDDVMYHQIATKYSGQTLVLDTGEVGTLSFSKKPTPEQLKQTRRNIKSFVGISRQKRFSDSISCLLSAEFKDITDDLIEVLVKQSNPEEAKRNRQIYQFIRDEVKAKEKVHAQELIREIKILDHELRENKTIPNVELSNRLKQLAEKIEKYAELMENDLDVKFNEEHKKIIYNRLQAAARNVFPQFYQRLDTYNEKILNCLKVSHKNEDLIKSAESEKAYVETTGFRFFKTITPISQVKKQSIVESLHKAMHKPFQISKNVVLLDQAISDIESSDDARFIKGVLINVATKYQPRNVFTLLGLVNSTVTNTHAVINDHLRELVQDELSQPIRSW